jgi:hypothetical protein
MIRLTLFLCAALFCAMLIGGQDRGQQRFGLMVPPETQVVEAPVAETAVVVAAPVQLETNVAMFAPPEPVMAAPVPLEATPAVESAPLTDSGKVLLVGAKSVNVRSGPGKDFDVVSRLERGEAVLVVAEGEGADGWSLIRIEGDGVEGYVASRLLTE